MVLGNEEIFSRHLEIIVEKTSVHLLSSKIVDQLFYFGNDHFLLEKSDKSIFHKNLLDSFVQFHGTTFENTFLIDHTPHKCLFDRPFSAIFFETFYGSHNDVNYLLQTILPYLESLHFSKMRVYKFVKLNHFGGITNVLLDDPWYAKLITPCSAKCDDTFYNKVKLRCLNKKR
jgi:hypothetical protein